MTENYYPSKWDNTTFEEKVKLSTKLEDDLSAYLLKHCGFKRITMTRDSIYAKSLGDKLPLPDLFGCHKNMINYFIELKSKNRRMKFNDNGIDYQKAEDYLKVQNEYGIKVLIVFKDDEKEWKDNFPQVNSWFKDELGNCDYYGNWIDKLHFETPENMITITHDNKGKKIKCFPLLNMKFIKEIFKQRQTALNFSMIK